MKLQHKHRQYIVLGIGILIILMGLIPMLFHIEIDTQIMDQVSFVLMIIGVGVLFGDRNKRSKKDDNPSQEHEEKGVEDIENKNS